MAAVLPNTGLAEVELALGVCGCNADLVQAITDEDIVAMKDFSILTNKDIETLAKTISSLPVDRGGCKMGIYKNEKGTGIMPLVQGEMCKQTTT